MFWVVWYCICLRFWAKAFCCCGSGVEHVLGKDEVMGSNPISSLIFAVFVVLVVSVGIDWIFCLPVNCDSQQ